MSIWGENQTIDNILTDLQLGVAKGNAADMFVTNKLQRKKARTMIAEVVNKHYNKKGKL